MFTLMKLSWAKRRPADTAPVIENVNVIGYEAVDGHRCTVEATIDGEDLVLNGRVYSRETYEIMEDGSTKVNFLGWGVQGSDHKGHIVGLRVEE